jgi:molybdate-binding protein
MSGVEALKGKRMVPRQSEAGSQALLQHLLARAKLSESDLDYTATARTETDAALMVSEGKADAALGLAGPAHQYRLGFVPLLRERFDLLVDRRAWFEPPFQDFLQFCRCPEFTAKAAELRGYDATGFGRVQFNGP